MLHIVHIVFSFDVGGLENGIVNLLNRLPQQRYRHSIVCLTSYNPEFAERIQAPNVDLYSLHKKPGKDPSYLLRLWCLLRKLKPGIVHSRNLATLECQAIAWLSGCRHRVHGEHGWDSDADKVADRPVKIRRLFKPLINRYIALSREGEAYLQKRVEVEHTRISRICNGVDTDRFFPSDSRDEQRLVVGSVGRLAEVKNQALLLLAARHLLQQRPGLAERVQFEIIGDGPDFQKLQQLIEEYNLGNNCRLLGNRNDIPEAMRELDLYVQPSKAEGISNTILEAMASGLPVIATDVGGARDLLEPEQQGQLIPSDDEQALAEAIGRYADDRNLLRQHGASGRRRTEQLFSLDRMTAQYDSLYQSLVSTSTLKSIQG
ncbi:TIGR03088 family PEP-CTERM/XrtA system glycosyltransferase [Motiliproteus coralliicola]|uniref:TIGR03088 family PEP-CTERM/XrtA system glycosyltransferase n=1 Tax=Motiliproteus coralliicola TaxID=2283196 RepID=A0A369WW65_9GAMM|nr:TIGR03088 family PEP-CTERM/XrtA system glycosyltransferase [Motiliproteus coralliicola]RDE24794.1 TIGR03088 family PEP-CTERM/XrtA system glycosyltransferase [Motiliproteus coralliicola]